MKGEQYFYCPIIGKRVKISGEQGNPETQSFCFSEKEGFCKACCGKCGGSCIGCGICEKTCTAGAVCVIDNHAVINEELCLSCGMCAVKCPRHAIYDLRGVFTVIR